MSAIPQKELPIDELRHARLSREYLRPILSSMCVQTVLTLLTMLVPDGGFTARMWMATLAAFWIGAAIILIRRPKAPAESDLDYLKIAFIPLLFEAMLIGGAILAIRAGWWHM
jgi:hypothetical protein